MNSILIETIFIFLLTPILYIHKFMLLLSSHYSESALDLVLI